MTISELQRALNKLRLGTMAQVLETRLLEAQSTPQLDTLFLALTVSWKGTLVQYAGRLHRSHAGKREVRIFDYVDRAVPMLARMFEKRLRGYRAIGYEPADLPERYARSVNEPVIEWDEGVAPAFE